MLRSPFPSFITDAGWPRFVFRLELFCSAPIELGHPSLHKLFLSSGSIVQRTSLIPAGTRGLLLGARYDVMRYPRMSFFRGTSSPGPVICSPKSNATIAVHLSWLRGHTHIRLGEVQLPPHRPKKSAVGASAPSTHDILQALSRS